MIYIVMDSVGTILRSGGVRTEDDARAQAVEGESVAILEGDAPVLIDDSNVCVVDGALAPIDDFPPEAVPDLTLNAL